MGFWREGRKAGRIIRIHSQLALPGRERGFSAAWSMLRHWNSLVQLSEYAGPLKEKLECPMNHMFCVIIASGAMVVLFLCLNSITISNCFGITIEEEHDVLTDSCYLKFRRSFWMETGLMVWFALYRHDRKESHRYMRRAIKFCCLSPGLQQTEHCCSSYLPVWDRKTFICIEAWHP